MCLPEFSFAAIKKKKQPPNIKDCEVLIQTILPRLVLTLQVLLESQAWRLQEQSLNSQSKRQASACPESL
jgi:hypothetical protein